MLMEALTAKAALLHYSPRALQKRVQTGKSLKTKPIMIISLGAMEIFQFSLDFPVLKDNLFH